MFVRFEERRLNGLPLTFFSNNYAFNSKCMVHSHMVTENEHAICTGAGTDRGRLFARLVGRALRKDRVKVFVVQFLIKVKRLDMLDKFDEDCG